ncbi:MAG: hypothetical protein ABJO27_06975 [Pseudoruegeria sp.]
MSINDFGVFLCAHLAAVLITVLLSDLGQYSLRRYFKSRANGSFARAQVGQHPNTHRAMIAAAGPAISFLQGFVCLGLLSFQLSALTELTLIWLSLLGFTKAFGDLQFTVHRPQGNFGKIANLLEWSRGSKFILALTGVVSIPLLVFLATTLFSGFYSAYGAESLFAFRWLAILIPWTAGVIGFAYLTKPTSLRQLFPYSLFTGVVILPLFWTMSVPPNLVRNIFGQTELYLSLVALAWAIAIFSALRPPNVRDRNH